jgi:glutamate-1-semialdehyde 2,1-aminomutase
LIPGGVDSPVRSAAAVGCEPAFIASGHGAYLWDVDGRRYIDYVGAYGPSILGHSHPLVVESVQAAAAYGLSFGAPTDAESDLAEMLIAAFPALELVRFVSSGTEATMSALRLARAATGRDMVLKFEGCYHGHADALLVKAGSGALTYNTPDSAGVTAAATADTLVAPYNDLEAVHALFVEHGKRIAAVIVEPVAGNMGVVLPRPGFLHGLRELTRVQGSLLVFDEVMTGFRLCYGGVQTLVGIEPDLVCLGKIIGGGLPLAAYGGRRDLMELVAPTGPVYQAGTLSGNPLAVAAGLATLRLLRRENVYRELEAKTTALAVGLRERAAKNGLPVRVNSIGAMFSVFFSDSAVVDYATSSSSDIVRFSAFYQAMRKAGVHLPPSPFEAVFVSLAHSAQDVDDTLSAAERAFAQL